MSELESTDNFCSFVNGDGDNDVTEVYEKNDDDQHDVRVEDEEEVDSELQNDDDGDYDEFWIPGHRKMSTSDIMQVENYRKVGIRPPYMYAAFANQCGGYDKVGFIRKDIYNEEGRMRKQHSSDARGALKYLYDLRKKDPMIVIVADYSSTYGNEVLQTNLRSLERSGDDLFAKEMFKLFQSYLCRTIKLRLVDCKEMVRFSVYTVVKYCSGSVWHVSYCPSTVDFTCTCMRMQSIGLPCDHILAVLVSLNFMELPSSLVLNRWSKLATEQMKDKYPDSAMYWDSQLMARYATLVEVSRQVCVAAYRDEEEYDKMLHFLSNEARRLKSKQNTEHCVDDNQSQQQDGDDFEVKDVDRSEWMNVADKGKSKSVANVVELATTSVLAPTVLGMEMAMKSFVNVSLLLNTDDYPSKNCGLSIEGNL
ncbi:hypothetical protein JHK87_006401 [Glycine soja]|nr:hypothetical protein JHK87_006401 [Glycine soja]